MGGWGLGAGLRSHLVCGKKLEKNEVLSLVPNIPSSLFEVCGLRQISESRFPRL